MAVVGIDLGTTNTVVGVVQNGQATTLRDGDGEYLIPSVVSFHPKGGVLVGRPAKERRVVDAANTIYSIKRLIGRSWNSEEVGLARDRFPFEMREGPGQAALVVARGETFTLPEISAFVLRHARTIAEKALGEPVDRAVITVPANFNDLQRAATKVAGRVAGIEVLRILNEPTAAALAYGYGKGKGERIAIYDFGGGTFDVTVLDLSGNVFEVLATAGNTFLGGDDIDLAIAEEMAVACRTDHRIDAHADTQIFERLRFYAERLKVDLSVQDQATVDVPDVGSGGIGKPVRLSFPMTRGRIEALAEPIVDRTFDVCREALAIARLTPQDLDQVVLVGGSTRLPIVRRKVEAFFGRRPLDRINPDEVVGLGAAIQASALSGGEKRRSVIPKPPMPAARSYEESVASKLPRKSAPPPHPRARRTDPIGLEAAKPGPPQPAPAEPPPLPGGRRRAITGMGLGPGGKAPPGAGQSAAPPPAAPPQRPAPATRGGTLGGVGPKPSAAGVRSLPLPGARAAGARKTSLETGPGAAPAPPSARPQSARPQKDLDLESIWGSDPMEPSAPDHGLSAFDEGSPNEVPTRVGWDPPPEEATGVASLDLEEEEDEPTRVGPAPEVLAVARQRVASPAEAALPAEEPAALELDEPDGFSERASAPPARPRRATTLGLGTGAAAPGAPPPMPQRSLDRTALAAPGDAPAAAQRPFDRTALASPAEAPRIPETRRGQPAAPAQPFALPSIPPQAAGRAAPPALRATALENAAKTGIDALDFDEEEAPAAPAPRQKTLPLKPPPELRSEPSQFAPAPSAPHRFGAEMPGTSRPPLPLLVDVTPLSLCVETAGGYRDVIIARNSPVPCEQSRSFVTARDGQTSVHVRVGQGESDQFAQDTLLGELELSGLRAAERGATHVVVTFSLDTDGMLDVRATDPETGQATSARLRLVGLPEPGELARMTERLRQEQSR